MKAKAHGNRIHRFDNLRGLAIVGVIVIHATAHSLEFEEYGSGEYSFLVLFNQLSRFAVPAFFVLGGFFLSYNDAHVSQPTRTLKKRITRVLFPYLFWSLFFHFLYIFFGQAYFDVRSLVEQISTGTALVPYYFMVAVMQFYLVWWLATKLKLGIRTLSLILLPAQLFFVCNFYLSLLGRASQIPRATSWMFGWSVYFVFGLIWGQRYHACTGVINKYRLIIILSTFLTFFFSLFEFQLIYSYSADLSKAASVWKVSSLLFSICMILSISLVNDESPALSRLAAHSFGIYLIHEPFLGKITPVVLRLFNYNPLSALPVLVGIGLLFPYLLTFSYRCILTSVAFERLKKTVHRTSIHFMSGNG